MIKFIRDILRNYFEDKDNEYVPYNEFLGIMIWKNEGGCFKTVMAFKKNDTKEEIKHKYIQSIKEYCVRFNLSPEKTTETINMNLQIHMPKNGESYKDWI
jgi:hypothetical protein